MSMEGVENVELHAGHHEVVQWLGLTFNLDTLIATWVTMAIVILITVLPSRGWRLGPVRLQNIVESIVAAVSYTPRRLPTFDAGEIHLVSVSGA